MLLLSLLLLLLLQLLLVLLVAARLQLLLLHFLAIYFSIYSLLFYAMHTPARRYTQNASWVKIECAARKGAWWGDGGNLELGIKGAETGLPALLWPCVTAQHSMLSFWGQTETVRNYNNSSSDSSNSQPSNRGVYWPTVNGILWDKTTRNPKQNEDHKETPWKHTETKLNHWLIYWIMLIQSKQRDERAADADTLTDAAAAPADTFTDT